jgi:integrase
MSASGVRRLKVILTSAFQMAVDEGWASSNPATTVQVSAGKSRAVDLPWTANDLKTFLEANEDERLFPAWRLLAVTGLRRGELLGLKWSDLRTPDIGAPAVVVTRSLSVVRGRPTISAPKTDESGRTVPIDDDTLNILVESHRSQEAERKRWTTAYDIGDWMFCRENGTTYDPNWFTRQTKEACHRVNVPEITPHGFRHLAATMLLEASVPTKVVSDLLGHSSTTITSETYQHVRESAAREAVGRISERI